MHFFYVKLDAQAQELCRNSPVIETFGKISNNKGRLEFQHESQQLSYTFNDMVAMEVRENCKNKCLAEKKFTLLFQSTFQIGYLQFNVSSDI